MTMPDLDLSRRTLLRSGGMLLIGFAASASLPRRARAQAPAANQVDSFLAIHPDGSVTIYTSKVDVGTGLATVMRQVAAEELDVPVERCQVVEGDTAITPDHGGTGGSSGVPRGSADIRRAAATARQELLRRAAERLGRPASEIAISEGRIGGIAIGDLIGGKRFSLEIDPKAPFKQPGSFHAIGKPVLRADVQPKCIGRHVFLQDFTRPGMLHARIIRPPAIGAKLLSVDEASLRGIPDVRVVHIESFLALVAKDEWAAVVAARKLKTEWSAAPPMPASEGFDRRLREGEPAAVPSPIPPGAKQLSATYYWPFQSHASLGPSCAVAEIREEGATVWTSAQGPHGLRASLAKMFSIPLEKMRVVYLDGSGSYGTNGADDAAADALLLARATGAPVRVQWSREDELGWDPKGPAQLLDLTGAIDSEGRIVAWETQMWLPGGPAGARAMIGPEAAGIPQSHGQGAGLMTMNGDPPYAAADKPRVIVHQLKETPLRLSNLRAPGKIANVFAVESFTDELAHAAGMDPLEFRLRKLSDPRALAVLRRAAEMIGWQPRPSPNPRAGTGRGIAYMRYKQAENYVAIAMEVAVDAVSGNVQVRRVTCAHDCGLIMNPDGLRNQVEGNIVQTLSRALHEEVTFAESRVTSVDWTSYPILTFPEAPAVEVALIDRPDQPPLGAGEAASAPVAGALANAIFDAAGARLRTIPFTPARVKAELRRA
jgi:CO/xanthine dehydrogenase Mo-binding subunit